jgi:hypothetical protein
MISGPELGYPPVVKATVVMMRNSLVSRSAQERLTLCIYLLCFRGALTRGSRCGNCLLIWVLVFGLRSQLRGASVVFQDV